MIRVESGLVVLAELFGCIALQRRVLRQWILNPEALVEAGVQLVSVCGVFSVLSADVVLRLAARQKQRDNSNGGDGCKAFHEISVACFDQIGIPDRVIAPLAGQSLVVPLSLPNRSELVD